MENKYLTTAMDAAIEAGRAIMKIYTDPSSDFEVEKKADNSPLTIADRKANEIILSYLSQTPFPVLSEEGKNIPYEERRHWKTFWLVDPLDGTKEFIKRNGEFTVNIALIENGMPVIGVVYVPATAVLYVGSEKGATQMTHMVPEKPMEGVGELFRCQDLPFNEWHEGCVVVASRSHLNEETKCFIDELNKQEHVTLTSIGSSLKICLVAEGKADLYPRFAPTMEWDTAAGHAIARAAGCELYQYGTDQPLRYNKEDLTNPWFLVKRVETDKE